MIPPRIAWLDGTLAVYPKLVFRQLLDIVCGSAGIVSEERATAQGEGACCFVKTESQALEENLEYVSFEEIQAQEDLKREQAQVLVNEEVSTPVSVLPGLPEGYVAPQDRVYEEENVNDEQINDLQGLF